MKINTNQTSDRLPQLVLTASSILRIHEGLKSGKKQATPNAAPEVLTAYDNLLQKGDAFAVEIATNPSSSQEVLPIDRAIDRIVSGIDDVSRGLQKIYDADSAILLTPEEQAAAQEATTFAQAALPNGIKFLIGSWRAEWAEIAQMLTRLNDEKTSRRVGSFDLTPVVERLSRAHEVYGKALKISHSESQEPSILSTITAWGEALDDLDTAVAYHHKKDAALRQQIFASFFAELSYLEQLSLKEKAKQRLATQEKKETSEPGKD